MTHYKFFASGISFGAFAATLCMFMMSIWVVSGQSAWAQNASATYALNTNTSQYTWVAFSSPDYDEALEKQLELRQRDLTCEILTGDVDQQTYYRLTIGTYNSRKDARSARSKMGNKLPFDAWLLAIKPGMQQISKSEWLKDPSSSSVPDLEATKSDNAQAIDAATSSSELPISPIDADASSATLSKIDEEDSAPPNATHPSFINLIDQHFDAELQFSNIYEDNIDHDEDFEAVQSYGMVPALQVQFRSSASDPIFTAEYLVARHSYSNTERWDRISNAFRGAFEPRISDALRAKTSVELSLKGSSEDRDISNQFQVVQELEYRFTRRHRLQLYGTYRVKRFPDQPGAKDFKPNVGLNFERTNSDGERFESGARYEFNKEEEIRGNYKRWTFTVGYRTPEINDREQFEIELRHRRKFYTARFVEIEDEDFLRQDNRLSVGVSWLHEFNRGVSMELGYEYETRSSNDPEKLYEANALILSMIYEL